MATLSERERRVCGCIEHRADEAISKISRLTGYREHSVRYSLGALIERNVIVGKAPFIDLYPLGYTDYNFYFSCSAAERKKEDALIKAIHSSSHVSWLASLGGDYHYGMSVAARQAADASNLFHQLAASQGNLFVEKAVSVTLSFHAFGRKYLSPGVSPKPLTFGSVARPETLEPIDSRILSAISEGRFVSLQKLAGTLGIPITTLRRRIARLEQQGIIRGYIYRLNSHELGMQSYRLQIYSRGINPALCGGLHAWAERHPQVIHFIECLGSWDYEIGVEVQNAENIGEIRKQLFDRFKDQILTIRVAQIFKHIKYSAYPFQAK